MRQSVATLMAVTALAGLTTPALAQENSDLVVMRRKIAPARPVQAPTPTPTPATGEPAPTPAPTPTPTAPPEGYGEARWVSSAYGSWSSGCSDNAIRTRTSGCMKPRLSDGVMVAATGECMQPTPVDEERAAVYSSCQYDWMTTDAECVGPAMRSIQSSCRRSGGDSTPTTVSDTFCEAQDHPETTRPDQSCTSVDSYSLRNSFDTGAPPFVFDSTAGLAGGRSDWYGETRRAVPGYTYLGFYSVGANLISMHPGPNPGSRAILRFVAPTAGHYSFSGRMYDDASVDGVLVFIDGQSSYIRSSSKSFSFVKTLQAGGSVSFEVDSYGNDYRDGTVIDLQVDRY